MLAAEEKRPSRDMHDEDACALCGREELLMDLEKFVIQKRKEVDSACPVVVLSGRGGRGKTRLALELSDVPTIIENFDGGVIRVDLYGSGSDPKKSEEVMIELYSQLSTGIPDKDVAAALVKAIGARRVIIIFDDAATSEQVTDVVRHLRGCLCVVTTRENLDDWKKKAKEFDEKGQP